MQTPSLQQLLEAGVHFGHKVSRGHPRMKNYIYGARDGVHIIDLSESEKGLKEACQYVNDLGRSGGTLLFIGTKKQAKDIIKELAEKVNSPFMVDRWVGGLLTNFEEVSKNIKRLKELQEQKEKGQLSKYTKKEQLLIDRKIIKLERELGGVAEMEKIPDAVFIIDTVAENTATREAFKLGIKVVAIADSNSDPSMIDYPIPGNDDAIKSIKIIAETVTAAFEEGQKAAGKAAAKKLEDEAKKAKEEAEAEKKAEKKSASAKASADKEEAAEAKEIEADVAAAEEEVEKETVQESERKVD